MRSKFLPTSHIIVHGPKRKNFKQKKLNSNLHAKQIQKETSILYAKTCIRSHIYKTFTQTYKYYKTQTEY